MFDKFFTKPGASSSDTPNEEANDNVGSGVPQESEKNEIPKLQIKEINRSEEKVCMSDTPLRDAQLWNNYLLLMTNNSDLMILDEELKIRHDFDDKSSTKGYIEWNKLISLSGQIYDLVEGSSRYVLDKAPRSVRGVIRQRHRDICNSSRDVLLVNSNKMPNNYSIKIGSMHQIDDGKGVLIVDHDRTDNFVTQWKYFKTETDDGKILPPRNWQEFDINNCFSEPRLDDKLIKKIENQLDFIDKTQGQMLRKINDKYSILISNDKVSFFTDDPENIIFTENLPKVRYVCSSKNDPNTVYLFSEAVKGEFYKIDLSKDPKTWQAEKAKMPDDFDLTQIRMLELDPSGSFMVVLQNKKLNILDFNTFETLETLPNIIDFLFKENGNLLVFGDEGYVREFETNIAELAKAKEKDRITKMVQGFSIKDIFKPEVKPGELPKEQVEGFKIYDGMKANITEEFKELLAGINDLGGVIDAQNGLSVLESTLRQKGISDQAAIDYITGDISNLLAEKAGDFTRLEAEKVISGIELKIDSGLSLLDLGEVKSELAKIMPNESLLDATQKERIKEIRQNLDKQAHEFYKRRSSEVQAELKGIMEGVKIRLDAIGKKRDFNTWYEDSLPQLSFHLSSLLRDCPLEADEAYKSINSARAELFKIADRYKEKFIIEDKKIVEKQAEKQDQLAQSIKVDIEYLIDRLYEKKFTNRNDAEKYLLGNESKKLLEENIRQMMLDDVDVANELDMTLKVEIANALHAIEENAKTGVSETGRNLVPFGNFYFPKWEHKVKEKTEARVDIGFKQDPLTSGQDKLYSVVIRVTDSFGHMSPPIDLYAGWDKEKVNSDIVEFRGYRGRPRELKNDKSESAKISTDFNEWSKGDKSKLRQEFMSKKQALSECYKKREQIGQRTQLDSVWQEEYRNLLSDYADFYAEHHLTILRRIDQIKQNSDIKYSNGKGYVPGSENHWVVDKTTEGYLELMAKRLKMQGDLQEGILNLKGHTGTGKDVLIKMFAHKTNRPYFATDCSKWTTEFELSEDITLENGDTVHVPSAVLNGIMTPGAIVYLNEFNAMTENAQIFLHSLMDEKRGMTLKTESGRWIKMADNVLLISSMNPNYPGTFTPQFATRGRMVSIDIDYPPQFRKKDEDDTNNNPPYDASEALRMAREISSLKDLTVEVDLKRNDFVKMWDNYINGINNGSQKPSVEQQFDINAMHAVLQFTNKLRESFIKIYEGGRDAPNVLKTIPATQPITGRELRRCAYVISRMKPEEKISADPEKVARDLLGDFYLTHIDSKEDRDKIQTAMATWRSAKRLGV
jgi:hypothetical protein